jgi:hypothetical protein
MARVTRPRKLDLLLWGFVLVPATIALLTESIKTTLVWYIRIVDLLDLTLTAPFYIVTLVAVHGIVFFDKKTFSSYLSIGLIACFMYGHAMHLTANAINTYSTEIHDYIDIIPADTYELIYFFDEILGHLILYLSLFGLLGLWSLENNLENKNKLCSTASGSLFGIIYAIALIESSLPWFVPVATIWLLSCNIKKAWKDNQSFINLMKLNPITRFTFSGAISLIIGELAYLSIIGSFIEPSKIGY